MPRCNKHNKITYLTICSICIREIKSQHEKELKELKEKIIDNICFDNNYEEKNCIELIDNLLQKKSGC